MLNIMRLNKQPALSYAQLILMSACYIALVLNCVFLYKVYQATVSLAVVDWLFLLSVPFLLIALTVICLNVFSMVFFVKPVLVISIIASALIFYSELNYGVIFDKSMMRNIVETNTGEAFSYFNSALVMYILLLGILPALFVAKVRIVGNKKQQFKSFAGVNLLAIVACFVILAPFYQNYAAVGRNHKQLTHYIAPFSLYVAAYKVIRDDMLYPPLPFHQLDNKPKLTLTDKSSLTIMVVGETARAANFSLHGYNKDTNRYTTKLGVKYFDDVEACGTATAISVPCMFSRLNHQQYDSRIASSQDNALDIIARSGVEVFWIDNNSSCKGVCLRVKSAKVDTNKAQALCDGDYCYDEVLIEKLAQFIHQSNATHKLVILHMIGSHGPTYYRRYPKDKAIFLPDCPRSDIQNCTQEQLVNTYDNTIAYTDFVLGQLIHLLGENNADDRSLLYVSDHGESLGEKGLFLHGFPYAIAPEEQRKVPLMYWSNHLVENNYSQCVDKKLGEKISHDNIFDTLLGLTHVTSKVYQSQLDIFNQCTS